MNIIDTDPESVGPSPRSPRSNCSNYNDQQIEGEKDLHEVENAVDRIAGVAATDKLRDVLPTVTQDTALTGLLDKLHKAEQEFAALTNDYNPTNNLNVMRVQSEIDELNHQIDDRVAGIMAGLTAR